MPLVYFIAYSVVITYSFTHCEDDDVFHFYTMGYCFEVRLPLLFVSVFLLNLQLIIDSFLFVFCLFVLL